MRSDPVPLPEATPILEAARAADELSTLDIKPGLVVANYVLSAAAATTPFGQARRAMQARYLGELAGTGWPAPRERLLEALRTSKSWMGSGRVDIFS